MSLIPSASAAFAAVVVLGTVVFASVLLCWAVLHLRRSCSELFGCRAFESLRDRNVG